MKKNGNNENHGAYYLGLDVGTNSVGWAVTDSEYNVLKFKGSAMWGVRLFEEAQSAADRRSHRTARRRLARQKQRSLLLQMLFAEEIEKADPNFFIRLQESDLHTEDKECRFSLFSGPDYTDKEYHKAFPTVYHLRRELMQSRQEHDVRLVFLALHHIIKSRGHFLYETSDTDKISTVEQTFRTLCDFIAEEYETQFSPADQVKYLKILQRNDMGISAKKKELRKLIDVKSSDAREISIAAVSDMLAGATVKFCDLFADETLKQAEVASFSLKNSLDDNFDAISTVLGERTELLVQLKMVFDSARLAQIRGGCETISEAKIRLYEKNRHDLAQLKKYVRACVPKKYSLIFSDKKDKLNNFAAYSGYTIQSGEYTCTQEDFCKFLKKELPEPPANDADLQRIYTEIQDGRFLTKLKGSDNGVIPYQLHKQELVKILDNASSYLPLLLEKDPDGRTVRDKIMKIFEFKVPYYVGPVHHGSKTGWAVRFADKAHEKVYPWNFEQVVDTEASADAFINNLIGRCTYTGEKVLPKDSLLYSEYMMRNELNPLRINGRPLPQDVKQNMINDLFYAQRKKVTKKSICGYLLSHGLITSEDVISGIDDTIKSNLRSYHDFSGILSKTGDYDMVEGIIRAILVFGEDKKMLRRWLKKNTHGLDDADHKFICRLKYSDWGRLSEAFLTKIKSPDPTGENETIMDYLRHTDTNLMQLLSNEYSFAEKAQEYREKLFGCGQSLTQKLDSMYIAPAVRRSIRQTLRIVDEIVDAQKSAPAKIFIEMARTNAAEMKNKRTESRKEKLIELYKNCGEQSNVLFRKLENEDDNNLRADKLYLYYLQLGKCMYSGEPIDLESLTKGELYDIDHIFPRSKIKDNSLDNRVLVKNTLNREKTNEYPIKEDIRKKMFGTWTAMKNMKLISEKKYDRLTRSYPLTDKELSDFVARQLVETQQATKALATLLKNEYTSARIVYSKAGNVSDFRHDHDMIKCRDVNDLHHAKDAYLNVVVGNVYCTKFTDRFFANIQSEQYSLNRVFEYDTLGAWDKENSIKTVRKWMCKNNVLVTRMPYEVRGQLFDLQLMPAGKGQLEKKKGLDINKYGGYNKLTGAYFCAVEYTDKKKRLRALQPVYVYAKDIYEADPIRYCEQFLALKDPKIIAPKIRIDALLELDGKRLLISGRTGSRIICKHTYQLAIDYPREKYIRNIKKYIDRCLAKKAELPITEHDAITSAQNIDLYDWFLAKASQNVYADLLKNRREDMEVNREKFCAMPTYSQCKILLEIIKAFKCNAENPDFSDLCNKGKIPILMSTNLEKFTTASIIHQSVTGLYEEKIDLLK